MPRTISADAIAALSSGSPRFVVLVRIETPSLTVRMTSESGSVNFEGEVYEPGTLGNIGSVSESNDISQSSIGIDFSGVDIPTLAVASSADFINSPVSIYLLVGGGGIPAEFRGDSTLVTADSSMVTADSAGSVFTGNIHLFSGYTAGSPNISYGSESKVSVICRGKFAALNRKKTERYADQDQQRKYPGDIGMQYASTVASRDVIWPSASWFRNNS